MKDVGAEPMPIVFMDMLRHLCSRPHMYVGEANFEKVALFLDGYSCAVVEYAPENVKATSFIHFGRWLSDTHEQDGKYWEINRREVERNLWWVSKFQRMYPNDVDALEALPELYQQFLDDPNRKPSNSYE